MSEPAQRSGDGRDTADPAFIMRLRQRISQGVLSMTSGSGPTLDYSNPPGDPGLFGPDAVCWRVHADFTSMMIGGISALMLQALHPLALAGVWDHSTFRTDMRGRLRRTATFIAGTTYGARADALALIERVKRIHLSVTGVAPDGRPYRASDPALLTWVHVAEVSSFLAAHLRYVNPSLSPAEQDRYYGEVASIAKMLGASDVPETRAQVAAYLASVRPQLEAGPRTHEVVRILRHAAAPEGALMQPAVRLVFNAGVDLLPDWAQRMLGFTALARLQAALARPGVRLVGPVIRWAHVNAVSKRARRRASPSQDA
ncbi:histidine kinase [Trinickia dabaoshanensis]|uniref:Histidine kinase n=1 Tax=Trinickia dabaoshanensis TaxID=564714 RepID=A0A2N7W1A2_9BURK|nr:histidine kinase [Trinickia dabaoshanensis]